MIFWKRKLRFGDANAIFHSNLDFSKLIYVFIIMIIWVFKNRITGVLVCLKRIFRFGDTNGVSIQIWIFKRICVFVIMIIWVFKNRITGFLEFFK